MNHSDLLRDTFGTLVLSLEELFHPALLHGLLNQAGQKLGREASARYRLTRKKSGSYTAEDYIRAATAGKIWPAKSVEVTPNRVRFVIDNLPTSNHNGALAPIISGFFGSAAAEQFGTARVVVSAGPNEAQSSMSYRVAVCLGRAKPLWKEGDLYHRHEKATAVDFNRAIGDEPLSRLSRRELAILAEIGTGRSTKAIATTLNLSVRTIQNATVRICRKLEITRARGMEDR